MTNQTRCIAHEIRNQISICELYSQIIKKHMQKDSYKNESVDNAFVCIDKALKIISNKLLDLKSLDTLRLQRFDLKGILKVGIDMSSVYVREKDIEILFNCPDGITVLVDENKFLACIVNIIKNAVESIESSGEIKISVKIDKKIHIDISNTGEKISSEVREHIFDEGYTTKKDGSGLGLPICKENLKLQNGDLLLNSSDETEFEIVLPVNSL